MLRNLGEAALDSGELILARKYLSEALSASQMIHHHAFEAVANFGLARVSAAEGKALEARKQAQDSMDILERLQAPEVSEIREWIENLDGGKEGQA